MDNAADRITVAIDEKTRTWVAQLHDHVAIEPDQLELLMTWVRQAATGMP